MKLKSVATAIITLSIAASPLRPVMAGDLGAGLIGALIGGVIVSEAMKDKRRKTASSGVREQRRQTQVALNYFNFPAGVPDGVFGARTRTAISNYQYYLGFPATGALTDYENTFLLTS
jgi:peptidoglycan hydrolase-like protein with peptidoglycan-binding domain